MARSKNLTGQEEASVPVEEVGPVMPLEETIEEAPVEEVKATRYEVTLPGQGQLPVGVNGKIKTLQCGVPLSVTPEVYNVLRDSGLIQ